MIEGSIFHAIFHAGPFHGSNHRVNPRHETEMKAAQVSVFGGKAHPSAPSDVHFMSVSCLCPVASIPGMVHLQLT